jgi:hypothetical protein
MHVDHAYGKCLDTKSEIQPAFFWAPSRYIDCDSLKPALPSNVPGETCVCVWVSEWRDCVLLGLWQVGSCSARRKNLKKRLIKWNFHHWYQYLKNDKTGNRTGVCHVKLPLVGLTVVHWGQASENYCGWWLLVIPECHKCRNCYCLLCHLCIMWTMIASHDISE